jgi:multidrug resistance efflux pump
MPILEFVAEKAVWKNGATWSFLFLLVLVILASFVSYADVLTGPIQVYSSNPPIHIVTKKSGQYAMVNATQNQQVLKGEVLAVLRTNASFGDIMILKGILNDDDISLLNFTSLDACYASELSLGLVLQQQYILFLKDYMEYIKTIQFNSHLVQYQNDSLKYSKSKQLLATLKSKELTQKRRVEIAMTNLERSKNLLAKGVISQAEYDKQQEYVNSIKTVRQQVRSELEMAGITNIGLHKNTSDASNVKAYDLPMKKRLLQMQRRKLLELIKDWELLNSIKSPMDGNISLIKPMNVNQYVSSNEHILTVAPLQHGMIIAECQLPIWNSGRLKEGMEVYLSLENYPSREWGQFKGLVASFSETPRMDGEKLLNVKVELNDMVTTYGKAIEFKQEMSGDAEIILEDVSLIQRIGYSFKDVWFN